MTPANPDALADALARELARLDGWQDPDALWTDNIGIIARGGEGSPVYLDYVGDAGKLIAGPLAPLLAAKEAAEARAAQLQAEVEAKDRRIALADRVKAQLEVAQNALAKIDRGGKPMREIAARALLDIAMVPTPEEATALARAAAAREGQADG